MSDQSSNMVKRRGGDTNQPRSYTLWEWTRGYAAWFLLLPLYISLWLFATLFPKLPNWVTRKLLLRHQRYCLSRPRDVRIPGDESIPPYMLRWWRIRRNFAFNCYYHRVLRSDEDAALHDHPWWNFSIVLAGGYWEHRILEGGVHEKIWYGPGSVRFRRSGAFAHRLELPVWESGPLAGQERPAWTIFMTGPVLRRWGFHHPTQWVDAYDWDEFQRTHGINAMRMEGYAEQNAKGQ